jgi:predicted  nucleic acid-binding Zn-ribbon protein
VCIKCGTELKGEDILNGCPKCGSKYFKFVNTNPKKVKVEEKIEEESLNEDSIESIKVEDKGIYEVNLPQMLDGDSEIYSDKEGTYAININALLKKGRKKEDK